MISAFWGIAGTVVAIYFARVARKRGELLKKERETVKLLRKTVIARLDSFSLSDLSDAMFVKMLGEISGCRKRPSHATPGTIDELMPRVEDPRE